MNVLNLTEEQFEKQFNTLNNHFYANPEDCPFGGIMYETYGKEYNYVAENRNKTLWSITEGDDENKLYLQSGFHLVNVIGYFFTKEEWNEEIIVTIDVTPDE